jgi:HPr kinase/phosphorylase
VQDGKQFFVSRETKSLRLHDHKMLPFDAEPRHKTVLMHIHASCAARDGHGVLLLGPPGSGKSDLLLRLIHHHFALVADDQVEVQDNHARPPGALAGLLEVRGLGILRLPYIAPVRLALAIGMGAGDRLPDPARHPQTGLPMVMVDPAQPSAAIRVGMALDCAIGRTTQVAGMFA